MLLFSHPWLGLENLVRDPVVPAAPNPMTLAPWRMISPSFLVCLAVRAGAQTDSLPCAIKSI